MNEIAVTDIVANPFQPRTLFDELDLNDLAESIRAHGVIQPLVVTPENGHYVLIAGERRLEAAKRAGLASVPAVVRPSAADQERLELALIENLQRADLTAIEQARAFERLAVDFGMSNDEIGAKVGRDRSTVANLRRLLALPESIQDQVQRGALSEGKARELIPIAAVSAEVAIAAAAELTAEPPAGEGVDPEEADEFDPPDPDDVMWDAWTQVGKALDEYKLPFGLDWAPPVETLEHAGEAVAVRACTGCPDLRQRRWNKLCTRPACLRAKSAAFAELELARVSGEKGIPVAAEGETVARVKVDGSNHHKILGWVTKPAEHLRLRPGGAANWNESNILGSKGVTLWTTKPHLLEARKAAGESPEDRAEKWAEQRKREEWEGDQLEALITRLGPALGKPFESIKPPLRREVAYICSALGHVYGPGTQRLGALAGKGKWSPAETLEVLGLWAMQAVIESDDVEYTWEGMVPELAGLARRLGAKLPKGWDVMPPYPDDAKAEKPAKKGKGKAK